VGPAHQVPREEAQVLAHPVHVHQALVDRALVDRGLVDRGPRAVLELAGQVLRGEREPAVGRPVLVLLREVLVLQVVHLRLVLERLQVADECQTR